MKSLLARFSSLPDKIIIALSIIGTLLLSTAFIALVAWPSFNSIGELGSQIKTEETKLAGINDSIAALSKEDKARLENLVVFLQQLVPEKIDNLHFATLNELVSVAAGTNVNNIQIAKAATPTPAAGSGVAVAPGVDTSKTTTPTTAGQTNQVAGTTVAVTYSSNFDSLLNLIRFWSLADQLVGIKDLNISGVDGGVLNYTINYELPVSPVAQKATVEDRLVLTEEQKKKLEDLRAKIIYTATPSANPVGKSNPFN